MSIAFPSNVQNFFPGENSRGTQGESILTLWGLVLSLVLISYINRWLMYGFALPKIVVFGLLTLPEAARRAPPGVGSHYHN
jgi:hypothetical protein